MELNFYTSHFIKQNTQDGYMMQKIILSFNLKEITMKKVITKRVMKN